MRSLRKSAVRVPSRLYMADAAKAKFYGVTDYAPDDKKRYNRGGGEYISLRGQIRNHNKATKEDSERSVSSFGTGLFSEVCAEYPSGENVLLSPLSVYEALTLVKDGATIGSDNEAELEQVLGPSSSIAQTGEGVGGDADVQLVMSSSIWANDLKQSYIDKAVANRSVGAFPLPSSYTPISHWIENGTNGMIKDFLGNAKLNPLTPALLVNTVYFNGTWEHQFGSDATVDGNFVLHDKSTLPARFMTSVRIMEVIEEMPELGNASAVVLYYGKDREFASMFILPATSDAESMDSVIYGLESQPISKLLNDTLETNVVLKLPRFKLEFGLGGNPAELSPALKNMGINAAFDGNIDGKFDEMSSDPGFTIDQVLHGAVMTVTERGTEAGAVTVIKTFGAVPHYDPPLEITFDRPFVTVLIHRPTGTPLFIGRVENPELIFD